MVFSQISLRLDDLCPACELHCSSAPVRDSLEGLQATVLLAPLIFTFQLPS